MIDRRRDSRGSESGLYRRKKSSSVAEWVCTWSVAGLKHELAVKTASGRVTADPGPCCVNPTQSIDGGEPVNQG